jgi:hypothetical protein
VITHYSSPQPEPGAGRRTTERRGSGERNRVDQEEEGPTGAARGESIAPHGRAVGPPPG